MEATGREGEASVLSCRIPNINHENHKESSRRPSQQVLVNVHRCPGPIHSGTVVWSGKSNLQGETGGVHTLPGSFSPSLPLSI